MGDKKKTEIRGTRSSRWAGYLIAVVMKLWRMTLRIEVNGSSDFVMPSYGERPVIFAIWHNRIFTMPPIWSQTGGKGRKTVVLTSASKDGTILATVMAVFGLGAIRGSSSRRAVSALIGMKNAIKNGYDVCVTPDGPRGPRYQIQPGIIKMAQTMNVAIIPIHIRYSSAWRLNSWDRFVIPKPFSKIKVLFDCPITVPFQINDEEFGQMSQSLQDCLREGCDDINLENN